jgi:hypothetical protein
MKAEKKRVGIKAQIRAEKERGRRVTTAIFLVFILLIVIFSSYFAYNFLNQPQNPTTNPASSQLKAAIVDQLSLTFPNQSFIETATNTLEQAGYTVDYYSGEKVTVDLYRNLPTYGYSLIILRGHSALLESGKPPVALFTSEICSRTKYLYEQLTDQLFEGHIGTDFVEGKTYFGIPPKFVTNGMKGEFRNTVVIAMGCNGLTYTDMAQAFIEKGAKAYIGWESSVSASHTDTATTRLLQHLITDKQTTNQAIDNTMKEVGPDPSYKSLLIYYPLEVGDYTIQNIAR